MAAAGHSRATEPRLNREYAANVPPMPLTAPVLLRLPNVQTVAEKQPTASRLGRALETESQRSVGQNPASLNTAKAEPAILPFTPPIAPPPPAPQMSQKSEAKSDAKTGAALADLPAPKTSVPWSSRMGSRIALCALMFVVSFATFIAINDQREVDDISPLASDDVELLLGAEESSATTNAPAASTASNKPFDKTFDASPTGASSSSSSSKPNLPALPGSASSTKPEPNKSLATLDLPKNDLPPFPLGPEPASGKPTDASPANESLKPAIPQLPSPPSLPSLPDRPPHNVPSAKPSDPVMAGGSSVKPPVNEPKPATNMAPAKPTAEAASGNEEISIMGPMVGRMDLPRNPSTTAAQSASQVTSQTAGSKYPRTAFAAPIDMSRYLLPASDAINTGTGPSAQVAMVPGQSAPGSQAGAGPQPGAANGQSGYPATNYPSTGYSNPGLPNQTSPYAGSPSSGYPNTGSPMTNGLPAGSVPGVNAGADVMIPQPSGQMMPPPGAVGPTNPPSQTNFR